VVERGPRQLNTSILKPELPYSLERSQSVLRVCLEIDRVSQSIDQLTERIENWRAALQSPYLLVPRQSILVAWVTTGTWRRARTIADLWRSRMQQVAFCTTDFELLFVHTTERRTKSMSERRIENPSQRLVETKSGAQLEPLQVHIREAARLLGYDERTIRRLVDRGELRDWQERNRC